MVSSVLLSLAIGMVVEKYLRHMTRLCCSKIPCSFATLTFKLYGSCYTSIMTKKNNTKCYLFNYIFIITTFCREIIIRGENAPWLSLLKKARVFIKNFEKDLYLITTTLLIVVWVFQILLKFHSPPTSRALPSNLLDRVNNHSP